VVVSGCHASAVLELVRATRPFASHFRARCGNERDRPPDGQSKRKTPPKKVNHRVHQEWQGTANATAFVQWLSALGNGFSPPLTAAALYDLLAAGGVTATAEALLVEDGPPIDALGCAYQQNRLAIALEANRAWPAAEMFLNAALGNYLARLGPNSRQDAIVQSNLGRLCHQMGRLAEARDHYRSALMSACVDPGPETDFTAGLLAENALLLYDLGDKDDAACALRKALAVRRNARGDRDPATAAIKHQLAYVLRNQSQWVEAERLYREALTVFEVYPGALNDYTIATRSDLGVLLNEKGEIEEAEALFRMAHTAALRLHGPTHPETARRAVNLAALLTDKREWPEADALYKAALEVYLRDPGPNDPETSGLQQSYAVMLAERGDHARAEALFRAAIASLAERPDNRRVLSAFASQNLAGLLVDDGRWAEAETLFQYAANTAEEILGEADPRTAVIWKNFAFLLRHIGGWQEAEEMLRRALAVQTRAIGQALVGSTERSRRRMSRDIRETLLGYVDVVLRRPESGQQHPHSDAIAAILRCKHLESGVALTIRHPFLEQHYPALRDQFAAQAAAERRLLGIQEDLLTAAPGSETDDCQTAITAARADLDRIESELNRQIPERDVATRLHEATIEAVSTVLPEGAALLEFFEWASWQPSIGSRRVEWRYLAFVITRDGASTMLDLGPANGIDHLVAEAYRAVVGDGRSPGRDRTVAAPMSAALAALCEAVWRPLSSILPASARRLFVSPAGDLVRVPFDLLPMEGAELLGDRLDISYLPFGRDVIRHGRLRPADRPSLVLAAPDYEMIGEPIARRADDRTSKTLAFRSKLADDSGPFTPLEGAEAEGRAVAAILGVMPTIGRNATKDALISTTAPRVLHLATHGFFLQRLGEARSAVSPLGLDMLAAQDDPLWRSGLALAGANAWLCGRVLPDACGNGLLLAADVTLMNLTGTGLVVLSACETGIGERRGDSLLGLLSAFTLAGAQTVIASLWPVPDHSTQILMAVFYHALLAGADRSEALRTAKRELRQTPATAAPAHWAGFILVGETGPLQCL